jgi:hypothetical protein
LALTVTSLFHPATLGRKVTTKFTERLFKLTSTRQKEKHNVLTLIQQFGMLEVVARSCRKFKTVIKAIFPYKHKLISKYLQIGNSKKLKRTNFKELEISFQLISLSFQLDHFSKNVRDYNSGSFFSTIEIVECDSFAQTL